MCTVLLKNTVTRTLIPRNLFWLHVKRGCRRCTTGSTFTTDILVFLPIQHYHGWSQVSVDGTWQLASRRSQLKISCQPGTRNGPQKWVEGLEIRIARIGMIGKRLFGDRCANAGTWLNYNGITDPGQRREERMAVPWDFVENWRHFSRIKDIHLTFYLLFF